MTLREATQTAQAQFRAAGNDDARFDALCLAQKAFGLDATQLRLCGCQTGEPPALAAYQALVQRRLSGEPLQYILGEWEFYALPFFVGQGVLIPRPETELLTELALRHLANRPGGTVFDLCAGSGCIGLSVAANCPPATVFLAELLPAALVWLRRNLARHALPNAQAVEWDVRTPPPAGAPAPDVILTNPPYIPSGELPGLAPEVRREPATALDGGEDGLRFYRAIARHWLPKLRPGGLLAAECGDGQAEAVTALFAPAGQAEILPDAAGIPRVVAVRKERWGGGR
ncbi:MAG: peptide chain release factor N(5)-glutamine methyltransferase [Oscillospiraceae bacterium]|jgi:release factor glutamine methyltransferase|nr:peptide chain release factor N(5)-glutamine methyltransferase [Oscillospiraceae bacterium]